MLNVIEGRKKLAYGFEAASDVVGMSKSFLRKAADDPDPERRLKTVRINRRRLIRIEDLEEWFARVTRGDESEAA